MEKAASILTRAMTNTEFPMIFTGRTTEGITDELALLFMGRSYPKEKLEAAAVEIDMALKTDRICPNCLSLEYCVMPSAKGWQVFFDDEASDCYNWPRFRWRQCRHKLQQATEQRERAMLTPRFQQRSFATFQVTEENRPAFEACRAYADNLTRETTGGLMLIGPPGTGKTHLAAAIVKVALSKGIPASFVVVPKLLDEIRQAIRSEEPGRIENTQRVTEKHLVVLDDLGAEKLTDWVREQMYKLINDRYERMLPTVITSNCGIHELEDRLGKPAVDRLAEMCEVVTVTGRSWRRRRAN